MEIPDGLGFFGFSAIIHANVIWLLKIFVLHIKKYIIYLI